MGNTDCFPAKHPFSHLYPFSHSTLLLLHMVPTSAACRFYCPQKGFLGIKLKLTGGSDGRVSACSAGDLGSIPGLGRSPGEGNGNPLQYSCLENSRTEELGRLQSMGSQRVGHD